MLLQSEKLLGETHSSSKLHVPTMSWVEQHMSVINLNLKASGSSNGKQKSEAAECTLTGAESSVPQSRGSPRCHGQGGQGGREGRRLWAFSLSGVGKEGKNIGRNKENLHVQ